LFPAGQSRSYLEWTYARSSRSHKRYDRVHTWRTTGGESRWKTARRMARAAWQEYRRSRWDIIQFYEPLLPPLRLRYLYLKVPWKLAESRAESIVLFIILYLVVAPIAVSLLPRGIRVRGLFTTHRDDRRSFFPCLLLTMAASRRRLNKELFIRQVSLGKTSAAAAVGHVRKCTYIYTYVLVRLSGQQTIRIAHEQFRAVCLRTLYL